MKYFLIICFIIWLYVLSVFKRSKLNFWFFLFGSVGCFVFMLLLLEPLLTGPLTKGVSVVAGFFGKITGLYQSYFQYGVLFINSKDYSISLYIDYECSGIIEIMAFTAMLWFFQVYHFYEKVILNIFGIIWIFMANVLRIFVICSLIYYYGNNIYYFAHTIFGRFVFYILSIFLYYQVFTRSQVIRQKIGSFRYENL
ncbi:MAG: exosortase family protein XrtG [Anaerolineaceae bacterium]|nr:MAG: exosortase family protein XrtG [Anaerolineaceae bacterium]